MKTRILVQSPILTLFLGACATGYKARDDGLRNLGYVDTKIEEGIYTLDVYGANFDSYTGLETLWRQRARELCQSDTYQAKFRHTTYEGKTWLIIFPIFYIDNHDLFPLVSGKLICSSATAKESF